MNPVIAYPAAVYHPRRSIRPVTVLFLLAIAAAAALTGADAASAAQYYEIRARHSNKCLDVAHFSTRHGADVIQGRCSNGANQQWRIEYAAAGGGYHLIARHSNRCLDVANYSYLHAGNVIQGSCHGRLNQQWKFFDANSGTQVRPTVGRWLKLVARHSNMCLDVAYESTAHAANVLQATCWTPGFNQQWRLYRVSG